MLAGKTVQRPDPHVGLRDGWVSRRRWGTAVVEQKGGIYVRTLYKVHTYILVVLVTEKSEYRYQTKYQPKPKENAETKLT